MDDCDRERLPWMAQGRPLLGIAICGATLVFGAVQHAYDDEAAWYAWAALAAIIVTYLAATIAGMRRRLDVSEPLYAVQAAVTVAFTIADTTDWYVLYVLLALVASAALRTRLVLPVVGVTTALWAFAEAYDGRPWSELWVTTLCLALAGFGTYVFCQLFATIAELNAARDALARNAVAAERERFSRDLHDVLGHSLSLIVVKAQAVRRLLPEQRNAAAEHAADIESIGRQALDDVRATVRGYRETTFETEIARARDALRSADVELEVQAPALPVAPGQDALLGWAVREAATNVLRHSDGSRCRIVLRRRDDRLLLRIEDNGSVTTSETNGGTGLAGLHERFAEAGGDLEAIPDTHGFTVTATLPATTGIRS